MTEEELGREIARINAEAIDYAEVARRVRELVSPALLAAIEKMADAVEGFSRLIPADRTWENQDAIDFVEESIRADSICREAINRARAKT